MYLVDNMRVISSGLAPEVCENIPGFDYTRVRCREILEKSELFFFTQSALNVASDLIIDTPERLEKVASAVFEKPRRIFIESTHADRTSCFQDMRGFPFVKKNADRHDPKRVGIDIECFGGGHARIGVVWTLRKEGVGAASEGLQRMMGRRPTKLEKEALREVLAFGVCFSFLDVDLSKTPRLQKSDFDEGLKSRNPEVRQFLEIAREQYSNRIDASKAPGSEAAVMRKISMEAWRGYRLNAMATANMDPVSDIATAGLAMTAGQSKRDIFEASLRDLDGELIYALAFLAALDAGESILSKDVRKAKEARRSKPASQRDIEVDQIAVTSFDISGSRPVYNGARQDSIGGSSGSKKSRHFVRGHLFLARNNQMTYRKPHWRGGLGGSRRSLKRVT
jgi:hypothetical protein